MHRRFAHPIATHIAHRRRLLLALLLICCAVTPLYAGGLPGWAKDAINADTTKFDIRAQYATLVHEIKIKYDESIRSTRSERIASKTLKSGRTSLSQILIPLYPAQGIEKFHLWIQRPKKKLEDYDKSVLNLIESPGADSGLYTDLRVAAIRFNELEIGSIIAYEFEIVDTGKIGAFYDEIILRDRQPVDRISVSVIAPKDWSVIGTTYRAGYLTHSVTQGTHVWSARDLPYVAEEPYMPDWQYLAGRISVACADTAAEDTSEVDLWHVGHFPNWHKVALWVSRLTDPIAKPSDRAKQIVDSVRSTCTGDQELMAALARFVQDNIRYVAVEIGDGRFVPRDDSVTLVNGYGDCKDMTMVCRALFEAAGFQTAAALVNVGQIANPYIPSPYRFNHCILAVRNSPDSVSQVSSSGQEDTSQFRTAVGWTFFDPTDKYTRFGDLSPSMKGRLTLIGDSLVDGLQYIPGRDEIHSRVSVGIDAELRDDGSAVASVIINKFEAASWLERANSAVYTDRFFEMGIESDIKKVSPNAQVKLVSRECRGDSCTLEYKVAIDDYALDAGSDLFVLLDFTAPRERPELTSPQRTQPIWFGPASSRDYLIRWSLGDEFHDIETPVDLFASTKIGEVITSSMWVDSTHLIFEKHQTVVGELLEPNEYDIAQEFERNLCAASMQALSLQRREK